MGLSQFDERIPVLQVTLVADTSTPGSVFVIQPSAPATRIDNLLCTTNNSVNYDVEVIVTDVTFSTFVAATVTVPALSGYAPGVPAVDLLATLTPALVAIVLGPNCGIEVNLAVALDAGKQINFLVLGGYV